MYCTPVVQCLHNLGTVVIYSVMTSSAHYLLNSMYYAQCPIRGRSSNFERESKCDSCKATMRGRVWEGEAHHTSHIKTSYFTCKLYSLTMLESDPISPLPKVPKIVSPPTPLTCTINLVVVATIGGVVVTESIPPHTKEKYNNKSTVACFKCFTQMLSSYFMSYTSGHPAKHMADNLL